MDNENYIRYYDNVFDKQMSKDLIKEFEKSSHQIERHSMGPMDFSQINVIGKQNWEIFFDSLVSTFKKCVEVYKKDCNITGEMFPHRYGFEQFRLKRYLPNNIDQFDNHVDVSDFDTARRFLVFFLYLNEPKGGETEFPQMNISVKPKIGRLLMFPPMWTHLHAGKKVTGKEPKYILGSYLHYVSQNMQTN